QGGEPLHLIRALLDQVHQVGGALHIATVLGDRRRRAEQQPRRQGGHRDRTPPGAATALCLGAHRSSARDGGGVTRVVAGVRILWAPSADKEPKPCRSPRDVPAPSPVVPTTGSSSPPPSPVPTRPGSSPSWWG